MLCFTTNEYDRGSIASKLVVIAVAAVLFGSMSLCANQGTAYADIQVKAASIAESDAVDTTPADAGFRASSYVFDAAYLNDRGGVDEDSAVVDSITIYNLLLGNDHYGHSNQRFWSSDEGVFKVSNGTSVLNEITLTGQGTAYLYYSYTKYEIVDYDPTIGDWHKEYIPHQTRVQISVDNSYFETIIKGKLSLPNLAYGSATFTGNSVPGSTVTLKIGKAVRSGISNSEGVFKVAKLPVAKIGTKCTVKVEYRGASYSKKIKVKGAQYGYSYYKAYSGPDYDEDNLEDPYDDGAWDLREEFNHNIKIQPTYASSKVTTLKVVGATKGDYFKVKIGKKTYTAKVKKSVRKATVKVKHPKSAAGSKITVVQYNKYKQKMGNAKSIVFSGSKLKKGMTKSQVKLLRLFGPPDKYSNARYGWWQYGSSLIVFFRGNSVRSWTVY